MREKRFSGQPSVLMMGIKTIAVLALTFLLLLLILIGFMGINVVTGEDDKARSIEYCYYFYNQKQYGSLKTALKNVDATRGDEFDLFWEITDACEDYSEWKSFAGAEEDEAQADKAAEAVIANYENCQYKENSPMLKKWAEEVKNDE